MGPSAERRMTVEEYLAFEETATERHQYLDGFVWAMSGGTDAHDALSTAMSAELRAALQGGDCVARGSNLRLKSLASGLYTYADAFVVCAPRFEDAKRTTLLNPRVVVEVLSDSTEAYDRGEKFSQYRTIPSIEDYVLVSTTARMIEVYSRGPEAWELRVFREGDTLSFSKLPARIAVEAIYDGVALDPARVWPSEAR